MTVIGTQDFAPGVLAVCVDADPTVTPVDAPRGSLIVYKPGAGLPSFFTKDDDGSSTTVREFTGAVGWFVDGSGQLVPRVARAVGPNTAGDNLGASGQRWGTLFGVAGDLSGSLGVGVAPSGDPGDIETPALDWDDSAGLLALGAGTGDGGLFAGRSSLGSNQVTMGANAYVNSGGAIMQRDATRTGYAMRASQSALDTFAVSAAGVALQTSVWNSGGRFSLPVQGGNAGLQWGGDVLLYRPSGAADVLALAAGDRLGVDGANASIETGHVTATAITDASAGTTLLTKGSDNQQQEYSFGHDGTPANYTHNLDLDTTGARDGDVWPIRIIVTGNGAQTIEVLIRDGSGGATLRSFPSGTGSADRYGVFVFDSTKWIVRTWHTVDA